VTTQLTGTETRLVERYMAVLDRVSRCGVAIDAGDWSDLLDKAGQLARQAGLLVEAASQAWQAIQRQQPSPRTEAVRAAVAFHGRHYRAALPAVTAYGGLLAELSHARKVIELAGALEDERLDPTDVLERLSEAVAAYRQRWSGPATHDHEGACDDR
jgi:hypothetical protein